jgi:hypothetical protein
MIRVLVEAHRGKPAEDGGSAGVSELAANAKLYAGPLPPKNTKVDYDRNGDWIFTGAAVGSAPTGMAANRRRGGAVDRDFPTAPRNTRRP